MEWISALLRLLAKDWASQLIWKQLAAGFAAASQSNIFMQKLTEILLILAIIQSLQSLED